MADDKKTNIFSKMLNVGSAMLDAQLQKAKNEASALAVSKDSEKYDESNFEWGKAVTKDRGFYIGSQGYQEKSGVLSFEYQKQMALKSSIIAAIVKTYQNKVAAHSEYVPQGSKPGFKISLKHERQQIEELKAELFGDDAQIKKAGAKAVDVKDLGGLEGINPEEIPEEPLSEEDKTREAKKELDKRTSKRRKEIADFIGNCGELENRPFETKKWTFDAFLRAILWDSLVYDQVAVELIPKEAESLDGRLNIHHFQPVDGSTIRYASPELGKYKDADLRMSQDILYPEEELKALEERDALDLNQERLDSNQYKFVQVIRSRIQRAFTEDELKIGMRNPVTDIYANGYSVSELELLVALVTSHLQTEFYNRSYFQQGFSAKGILHIKANLNRTKLEELRRNWNHMVKGNRNSFQTPIMAGMDDVQWIPLTQSHSEMEFSMWLNYLVRMICAIYQIDPSEINYGLKDIGGGGGISGDNTKEKLDNSRDKGFVPLMKFVQGFINKNIIEILDPDYMLEWVGLEDETDMSRMALQKESVQWKMTVNEVRALDGLPPIKGADSLILNPVYFQWFSTMSPEGQDFQAKQQQQAMAAAGGAPNEGGGGGPGDPNQEKPVGVGGENNEGSQRDWEANEATAENDHARSVESKQIDHKNKMQQIEASQKGKALKKAMPVKIEYYRLGD